MKEKPTAQTKAELWRTVAAVSQLVISISTLVILIIVHFL